MTYYAQINSKNILSGIGNAPLIKDEYGSADIQNIEVTEYIYNNAQTYGDNYYIYSDEQIVVNPEWESQQLELRRTDKLEEALTKAYEYEQTGTVEYKNCEFEMSITNRNNLRDTVEALSALEQTATTWNDKNDELVVLTLEDIQYIRLNLILGAIQKLWIEDYPAYKQQILEAATIEELDEIEIDYADNGENT